MIENIDGYGLMKVTKIELIKLCRSAFGFGLVAAKELVEAVIALCEEGVHPTYLANKALAVAKHVNDGDIKLVDGSLVYEKALRFPDCDGEFTFTADEVWDILAGKTEMKKEQNHIFLVKKMDIDKII